MHMATIPYEAAEMRYKSFCDTLKMYYMVFVGVELIKHIELEI